MRKGGTIVYAMVLVLGATFACCVLAALMCVGAGMPRPEPASAPSPTEAVIEVDTPPPEPPTPVVEPTATATATSTPAPAPTIEPTPTMRSVDSEYLECAREVVSELRIICLDISGVGNAGDLVVFCQSHDVWWRPRVPELERAHLSCPSPEDENLQRIQKNFSAGAEELTQAVDYYGKYCHGGYSDSDLTAGVLAQVHACWLIDSVVEDLGQY